MPHRRYTAQAAADLRKQDLLHRHGIPLEGQWQFAGRDLSHLRSLPFDVIKIDRSFISTIHRDRESAAIVRAVTTLATALDVPVTVEGIEDAATEAAVLGMGCTIGQGWYFGKPMAAEQAAELLRTGLGVEFGTQSPTELRSVG